MMKIPKGYYTLDLPRLLPGDIVLSTTDQDSSKAIRIGTDLLLWFENPHPRGGRKPLKSDFSHAAIYIGDNTLYEAIPSGVVPRNVLSMAFAEKNAVKVLRLNEGNPDAEKIRELAVAFVKDQHMKPYANKFDFLVRFIGPRIGPTASSRTDQFICSHLVAEAYASAHCPLLGELQSEKVTPAELLKSPHLQDMTEKILKLHRFEKPEELVLIDRESEKRLVETESEITIKVVKRCQADFKKAKLPPPLDWVGALDALASAPATKQAQLDKSFLDALNKEKFFGYVDLYLTETKETLFLDKIVLLKVLLEQIDGQNLIYYRTFYENQLAGMPEDLKTRELMYMYMKNRWELTGLETFRVLMQSREKTWKNAQRCWEAIERAVTYLDDDQVCRLKEWWAQLGPGSRAKNLRMIRMEIAGGITDISE
jgi:Permuted papain-like amidase enzyme, YaeF/YiiX, C92 family